jgi:hypothetical protein
MKGREIRIGLGSGFCHREVLFDMPVDLQEEKSIGQLFLNIF